MAKLSTFRVNSAAQRTGEWVRPGDEYLDLEILTRGLTDAYFDAQAAMQRRAAVAFGFDVNKIPQAQRREINTECLLEHVVMGVRNLEGDDGQPVTFDQFCAMLRDPDFAELNTACFQAAAQVGRRRNAEVAVAVPSSERPSV